MIAIRTVDAHVGGAPLRLVVDGFPSPRGRTMAEKRAWASARADQVRRLLMLEPRGHLDMTGAVFTEPVAPGSDAGLLFMSNDGYGAMSGHSVVGAVTVALERGLLMPRDPGRIVLDTPAGTVRAAVERDAASGRVSRVSFVNVPSFVWHPGVDVPLPGRRLRADVAYGGEFYAIVDAESAGIPVDGSRLGDLRRVGAAITAAVDAALSIAHPIDPAVAGLAGTIFTAPPQTDGADLRSATVFAGGAVDRSPGGTGTCAVMAVLDAMGLLASNSRFTHESLTGQTIEGCVVGRTSVAALDAVLLEISAAGYITGEHTFVAQADDPFKDGFRLS